MARRGLPGELERETTVALREIYLKYRAMKKSHLSRDRIRGIMYGAFVAACVDEPEETVAGREE